MAHLIDNSSTRSLFFIMIVSTLVQAGKVDEAISLAHSMDEPFYNIQALAPIAKALAESGKVDEAQQLFNEAIDMAHSIDDSEKRRSLIFIAKALAESGKVDEAQQLFSEAIDMAHSIDEPIYKRYELASIAKDSSRVR